MLSDKLKAAGVKSADEVRSQSLWNGPQGDGPLGGITFSMLSRFLQCRERFRCYAIEGLKPRPQFNHRVEYGNMWHLCEEIHGYGEDWSSSLAYYAASLCRKYTLQQQEIIKWRDVCCVQFPIYLEHWSKEEKRGEYKTLLSEKVFDVRYTLPSGRTVRLRGKLDALLLKNLGEVWLKEVKTKGDIDTELIPRQLTFDLQTLLYLIIIHETRYDEVLNELIPKGSVIKGVSYDCIRRPLSGGKGTIVRHKATKNKPEESHESYYRRLKGIIDGTGEDAPGPKQFFYRWEVEVSSQDIERFKRKCFDPLLEQLCHWYELMTNFKEREPIPTWALHFQQPYGVTQLEEYGPSAYDRYLETGDTAGLEYTTELFTELQ